MMKNDFEIEIGNCKRQLKKVDTGSLSYYSFNLLGDMELNKEIAKELAKQIDVDFDYVVTIESKAIALTQELCSLLNVPRYVVIRKNKKNYMKNEISVSGNSIISGDTKYYLDGADKELIKNKNVIVIDDVISTCGTIDAVKRMMDSIKTNIKLFGCGVLEEKIIIEYKKIKVVSCGFIPLEINK